MDENEIASVSRTVLDPRDPATPRRVREAVLEHLHRNGGGHFGGCASCVEILLALFASRPLACRDGSGDRLLLSKGHASMTLYAALSLTGPRDLPLARFGDFGSPLQGHPDRRHFPAVDFSSGSLGQGVAVGLGLALGLRSEGQRVWVVVGDGECQEGMIWESALLAARYRADNLHVIVDVNGEQECGWSHDPELDQRPLPDAVAKWRAFGWLVEEVDGHDFDAVAQWMQAQGGTARGLPSVLIARTRKRLVPSIALPGTRNHHTALTDAEYLTLREALAKHVVDGGNGSSDAPGRVPARDTAARRGEQSDESLCR